MFILRRGSMLLFPLAWLAVGWLVVPAASRAQLTSALSDPEPPPHRLIVTVHTRNNDGKVYCAIWRGPRGYPTEREHNAGETRDVALANHRAVCVFDDVTPGEYAVAVFHDENGNNDLDRNLFGIPSEGTGASNDAHNMFGPPSYEDARFTLPDARLHRETIHIHY
ncbi:MAG: DUF2141 domain-containing protein [Sandaracinaceae bacterium]